MLEFPKQVSTVLGVVSAMTSFCLPLLLVGMADATSLNTSSWPRSKPDLCIAAHPTNPQWPKVPKSPSPSCRPQVTRALPTRYGFMGPGEKTM
jgi:hypothetical protein